MVARPEFAHKCSECGRRWTHKGCDGFGSPRDVCGECGSVYYTYIDCIYEDEFSAYVEQVLGRRTEKES